ncbi:sigma factor-like helix-turn-helix DNA-binding protein [Spongiactinospora gelatinilytica]|uniref:sigma factor-like helix-turn-helix DNA-binding protein n=1 Tax=Spongiactinospora gelatinilytica TaxID=2666298 RepID=UPI001F48A999|nr:sigma factor-like helix-turn-helix DNA-binding protein [Spongiactinospora gelatinilytica]
MAFVMGATTENERSSHRRVNREQDADQRHVRDDLRHRPGSRAGFLHRGARPGPDEQVALADSVGFALLVVLDSLTPSERLAFVLHDIFAVPFRDIGKILGKSPDATKMIASRARRKVQAVDRPAGSGRERQEVVRAFRTAALSGDFEALLRVLDPNVKLTVDTPAGMVVTIGATEVATGARMFSGEVARQRPVLVNGIPGHMSWRPDGTPLSVIAFTVTEGRITGIHVLVDPARLAAIGMAAPA